jgi:hypothetical protein
MDDVERDTYEGVGPNGIDVRLYNGQYPSVTTILKTRNEDTSALDDWKADNDGEGDNAYHKYLFWYSRQLGTLGHWNALSTLGDVPYSTDEAESRAAVEMVDNINDDSPIPLSDPRCGSFVLDGDNHTEIHDASSRDILYSLLKDRNAVQTHGEFTDVFSTSLSEERVNTALVNFLERDIQFFVEAQQHLWDQLSLTSEDVITIEQFLVDDEYEYAGQVDLVYRDPNNGDVVVADLKSSSGCYDKHQLQSAAYGKAIEREPSIDVDTVDRLEVHRTHPKTGKMAVHTNSYTYDFHKGYWWNITYESGWQTFKELADNFEYSLENDG